MKISARWLEPEDLGGTLRIAIVERVGADEVWFEGLAKPVDWEFPIKPKRGDTIVLGVWQGTVVPVEEYRA